LNDIEIMIPMMREFLRELEECPDPISRERQQRISEMRRIIPSEEEVQQIKEIIEEIGEDR
jgi:hypothetical protein